jgi:hypothetical protein
VLAGEGVAASAVCSWASRWGPGGPVCAWEGERGEGESKDAKVAARSGSWAGGRRRWAGLVVFFFFFKSFSNLSQTLFKFKSFTQIFTIIFKNFHKYFKTFKTTPQPKLIHSNHDAQALIASKLLK